MRGIKDGRLLVGWKNVLASWEAQADLRLGGKIAPDKMQITVGHTLAVTQSFEVGENVIDGKVQKVSIRATNVFRHENGKWKMIGHHTDTLPFLKR